MKGNIFRLLIQSLLLLCLCIFFESNVLLAQSGDAGGPNTGRIVQIDPKEPKGKLKVIQARGLEPINAAEQMLVRKGNVLILDPGARAFVLCGGGDRHEIEPGPQPCPCREPCSSKICNSDRERLRPTRGPDTDGSSFPVILSPRATFLTNLRPTIRWTPVVGAKETTTYKVTLYAENMKIIWTSEVIAQTSLAYPAKAAPLTPGQTYNVVVVSEGRSSEEDRSPGLGFTVIDKEKAKVLEREILKIKRWRFPETQTRFLISTLYADAELYAEAIEQLTELYRAGEDPVIARALGDSYAAIGLNREAERNYLESLRLQDPQDLEGVGLTQKNLAGIYERLGIFDETAARLEQAIKAYDRLGNAVVAEELKRQQKKLKRQ